MTSTWTRSKVISSDDIPITLAVHHEYKKDEPFSTLRADYHKQLKELMAGGSWKTSPRRQSCDDKRKNNVCIESKCNGTLTFDPEESLKSMMRSMKDLDLDTLKEITRLLRPKYSHTKVMFVTAVSSNHYRESQGLVMNLHDYVFPLLTKYSFVLYDLGLTLEQRSEFERFCGCEVRTFPMSTMPPRLRELACYTWKPLIINANLPTTDTLIWADSSVRFKNRTILDLLQMLDKTRLGVWPGITPIAYNTKKTMFDYFEEQTCSFSHVRELSAGFAGYKNDRFVREVVIKPWTACALSSNCMCPENALSFKNCSGRSFRKYNHCHRYDQSALGIVLTKLFRGHGVNFRIPSHIASIRRGNQENYFDKIKTEKNIKKNSKP